MPSSVGSRAAFAALVLVAMSGCATRVAQIEYQWGTGRAVADIERPVLIEDDEAGAPRVSIPIRATGETNALIVDDCTVRAVWVSEDQRRNLVMLPPTAQPDPGDYTEIRDALNTRRLSEAEVFALPAEIVTTLRLPVVAERDQLQGATREPTSVTTYNSFLVEVTPWSVANPIRCGDSDPPRAPGPEAPRNLYLVDLQEAYPAGGSAFGGGALIIGVVALTALAALLIG